MFERYGIWIEVNELYGLGFNTHSTLLIVSEGT
jgi:hypothetical protein